jgi:hypothetical protein
MRKVEVVSCGVFQWFSWRGGRETSTTFIWGKWKDILTRKLTSTSRCTSRWTLSSKKILHMYIYIFIYLFQVKICGPNSNNSARGHNSSDCEHNSNGMGCLHNSYGTVRHNSRNSAGGHNLSDSVNIIPVMWCVDLTKSTCKHISRNCLTQFHWQYLWL